MNNKIVDLCGEKTTCSFLRWIFKEFKKDVQVRQFDTPKELHQADNAEKLSEVLILDAGALKKSPLEVVNDLHSKRPSLKILLIVFPTTKDEIVEIVKANVVKGIIVRPFTGELICSYVDKLL
jgi:response regulator RpfG family c-di-GMP phosphodiesterase